MQIHCLYDELRDPSTLKNHPRNRNMHGDDQIERLAELYKYHGVRHPIIVSTLTDCIVAGHGRKLAAIRAGIKEMPVVYQDFDSSEAEYAFLQADNAIAAWSELDLAGINTDLSDLGPDFDINMLGIQGFTLDVAEKTFDGDPDEIPEEVEPNAKLGQIYKLGEHRLMCGDSTSKEQVYLLMDSEKADMVFTDPPYEMKTDGGGILSKSARKQMKEISENGVDRFNPEVLSPLAPVHVFFHNKPLIKKYIELSENWSMAYDLAIYKKNNPIPNYKGHMTTDLEYIAVIGNLDPRKNLDHTIYSKLYCGNKDKENKLSYSKPVELCEKFIQLYSDKSVLDLFGGSGSTLIACEKTNRKCFMMELDPHYVDVIIARWEKFTGQKAELLSE